MGRFYIRRDDVKSKWIYDYFSDDQRYGKFDLQCEYLKYSSPGEFLRDLEEELSIIPRLDIDTLKKRSYLYRKDQFFHHDFQFIPGRQSYLIQQFKYYGGDTPFYLVGSEWLKEIILDVNIPIREIKARLDAFKRLNELFGEQFRKTHLIEKLEFYYDSRKSLEEIKKHKIAEEVILHDEEQKLKLQKDSILLQKRYEELIKSISRLIEVKEQEENSKIEEIEKLRQELNQTQNELNRLK